jgi:hypothetical protein
MREPGRRGLPGFRWLGAAADLLVTFLSSFVTSCSFFATFLLVLRDLRVRVEGDTP